MARRPNFLVIGAQKCGTSYLCAALSRHPSVFHTDPKEPLFFQRGDVSPTSFGDYLDRFFAGAGDQPAVGEGSTVYLQWPNALRNIRCHLGDDLKLIVCLRHPTDRAVSFYLHNLRKGRFAGDEPIAAAGNDLRTSPALSSRYAPHLERWLEAYPGKLEVILFDTLLEDPAAFVGQATDFLGIPPAGRIPATAVNKGFDLEWRNDCLTLAQTPDGTVAPAFSRGELEDLHARFQDDIAATEALTGLDLSAWRRFPQFTGPAAATTP